MADQLECPSKTSDSDESDDSSVPSRYSSEGDIPLPTYDVFSDSDDAVTGLMTSGCMLPSSNLSITEQRNIGRILSDEARQPFFCIFPAVIEGILTTEYAHIVQRLRELPGRDRTVIISAGSLLKMVNPSWEGRVPASVLCDVCVFSPTRPVLVLTFTAMDGDNQKHIQYNTMLARLIIQHVKEDTKFDFNVVHETVDNIVCQEKHGFLTRIDQCENSAKSICFPAELHMDHDKCTAIIQSFLNYLSGNELTRRSPSSEDKAGVKIISKPDALDELRQHLLSVEVAQEHKISEVNHHHEMKLSQLMDQHAQQKDRLEKEIEEFFLQLQQERKDKTVEPQRLDVRTRTSSKMDAFPKCSICQQQFTLKSPVPYLLPCLHAVCETCVTSAAGGVISCFTCQREVNLTDTSLQKDAVRQKEIFHLTVKHRPTELLCTNEDDGNQAVCWCQDCEEFLCEYCQNMHSSVKLTKNHVLQNFGDMGPTVSNIPSYCSIHKHHPLYLFDKSCKKLICARCRIEDHADHEVVELDVVADTVTKQLDHHKNELSKLQARQQSHMQSLRQGSEFTDKTHNTLKESIGHTFQSLRSQLDQREKELLIDLESQTKETKSTLYARLNTCEEEWKTCTGALDYIAKVFLYASKSDLVESYVGDITRNYLETAAPQTHVVPSAVFNTNSLSTLKSTISVFGAILPREVDEESVKDKDTQTDADFMADLEMKHKMDLTELKTKIGSDEKHMQGLKTLTDKLNAEIKSLKSCIDEKETSEKRASKTMDVLLGVATDCGVHLLKSGVVDRSMVLKCIHLKYDKDRVNLDKAHINTEGDLVNRKSDTRPAGEGRLKKYHGTCSTAPLPRAGCPQYWEVVNRVSLDKPLTETWLILEVGVCREEQRDVSHCINAQPSSYCMLVAHCPTHGGICRETWKEGKHVLCLPDTLPNTAGTSHTLHYGVVYDDARKKIVFIDVKENKVMSTLDNVDSSQPLWPMFGVYNPSRLTVSMTLVVGSDINMTEEKKAMIVKALS
ncbi:uncharacterized protein LOC124112462 isoform X3 [Haliotis rufescens]|uniref:uncharacterized protein LOC124112462 isoform X3 n=1 Tax=Haliotis rufescens TaxID=6454 RepID=UPI00201EFC65|nr:uncharacterized protein LOC124112462 isoform X3 [Haliotis rufescens]